MLLEVNTNMRYIHVKFEDGLEAYQEVVKGQLQRYVNMDGVELFIVPPVGIGCKVVEENPTLSFTPKIEVDEIVEYPSEEITTE
jgi:hypothetical protein